VQDADGASVRCVSTRALAAASVAGLCRDLWGVRADSPSATACNGRRTQAGCSGPPDGGIEGCWTEANRHVCVCVCVCGVRVWCACVVCLVCLFGSPAGAASEIREDDEPQLQARIVPIH